MIDLRGFRFSIIYQVDVDCGVSLENYTPPDYAKNAWLCTERDSDDTRFTRGRHRKHCAILTFDQFVEFMDHVEITTEERTRTCGVIGAPGYGFSWAPAVLLNGYNDDVEQMAYVTPISPEQPENLTPIFPGFPRDMSERIWDWDEVERTCWDWFEAGGFSADAHAEELK